MTDQNYDLARGAARGATEAILDAAGRFLTRACNWLLRRPTNPPGLTYWLDRPATIKESFIGRDAELEEIRAAFRDRNTVVLSGFLGSGKSRLTAEFTYRRKWKWLRKSNGFWTTAGETVDQTLAALAPAFADLPRDLSLADLPYAVKTRLSRLPPKALWVVDNLPTLDLFPALRDAAGPVRLLITTRDDRSNLLPAGVFFRKIEMLSPDAAITLLAERGKVPRSDPNLPKIAEAVGFLPYALEMLAVRLGEQERTPASVFAEITSAPNKAQFDAFQSSAGASLSRPDGVFQAIIGSLSALSPTTRACLAPLGYLADAPIPRALALALTGLDEAPFLNFLQDCRRQAALTSEKAGVSIHALTIGALRATNDGEALHSTVVRADNHLRDITDRDPLTLRSEIVHHLQIRTHVLSTPLKDSPEALAYSNSTGIALRMLGLFVESVRVLEQTLAARERTLGPGHPYTLTSRNNLATAYRDAGRLAEAIALHEQTLTAVERLLGPDHPDTLASRNNLATAYRDAGRLDEAIPLFEQTLTAVERLLGPDHPYTLTSRNNLAAAYRAAGRLAEALRLEADNPPPPP